MARSIDGKSQRAYRVVRLDKEGNPIYTGYENVFGPYSTLSAAKGKRTSMKNGYYGSSKYEYIIEQTPEGWEKVEV